MLDVSQLTRTYGAFKAVDNVGFTIKTGEIVGLLGHNGAGKTTIMKMISGYLEPSAGSVTLDGIDLAHHPKDVQRALGYLPENLPVYPEMIVADYLDYAADLKGLSGETKKEEIRRVIKATDIGSKIIAPISTLSRGFKQRVGVAQAILGKPKLLILDEPTNGLDPEQTLLMRKLIKDIAEDATVILSTHIMQEVEALCSRVLMLRSGRLAVDEMLDNLKRSNSFILRSDLELKHSAVLESLAGVQTVASLESGGETNTYRVTLNNSDTDKTRQSIDELAATIAGTVIAQGAKLYELKAETRDLESLFKEVNQEAPAGGSRYAA